MPDSITLRQAICRTRRDFKLPEQQKLYHLCDVFAMEDLNIWRASPGLPWNQWGYRCKRDIRDDPEAVKRVRKFWSLVKTGCPLGPPDSQAFVRAHLAPVGETKVRAIWGYPATITFGEAQFALPLINGYKNHYTKVAYGYESAVGGFKKLFQRFSHHPFFVTMDFSAFDKTVPKWLIEVAFDILLDNLDLGAYEGGGTPSARKMLRMWDYLKQYFIYTPIRLCNGERYRKTSGVASGSYFTQILDSVVNAVLTNWIHLECTGYFPRDYLVLGDDSLVGCERPLELDKAQELMRSIGMNINYSKTGQSASLMNLTFLGYKITTGIPSRPVSGLMASLLLPERPDREFSDVQNRALGLLYAALGEHEEFHNLCTAIIRLKPFDIALPSYLRRHAEMVLGCTIASTEPPTQMAFIKRLL